MGDGWSDLSGRYCQEEDQRLHLGDTRLRYGQTNRSSDKKEGRYKSEKILGIKTHIYWSEKIINVFKFHRSQIKKLKGEYWIGLLEVH